MVDSAFSVNVATIMHKPGTMRELELDVVVPERIGEGMLYFDRGAELEIDLRLETLVDGILATADVHGTLTGQCSRCLDDIAQEWDGHIAELYGYELDESIEYAITDDRIDLEGPIRDAVVLELPFQPLCAEDCYGLDPETGEKRTAPAAEPTPELDPRWAALEGLLSNNDGDALTDAAPETK
ncbi:YceD family protein [Gulosibacter bifidus]|uniref:YceD family protein n=1 Tax=Gulosibacter bifidus TaxID=272239 RepID=A0ABW5RL30_9MICO|nr:DUF177 domain-containing protein [Gulosibacter bifidus]